jgi:hypothetical protein
MASKRVIFAVALGLGLLASCATTTSPAVPKPTIEKAADTKVPEAGADAATPAAASAH